jgi:hypothetical protein
VAVEKTIENTDWDCKFELYVDAQDTWQVGTQLEVLVRLTLVQKGIDNYDYKPWDGTTEYVTSLPEGAGGQKFVWLSVVGGHIIPFRPSDQVRWGTLEYDAAVNLTKDGDYWERQFRLDMFDWSADYLGRGKTDDATLHVELILAEYDVDHTLLNEPYVGGSNTTVGITVFRPLLSTTETYVVGGVGSILAVGLLALALHRIGRLPLCRWGYHSWRDCGIRVVVRWREPRALEDPSHPSPVSKLRKEDTVMSGRKCRYCGLHQERKFTKNEDGEWEVAGWENANLAAEP